MKGATRREAGATLRPPSRPGADSQGTGHAGSVLGPSGGLGAGLGSPPPQNQVTVPLAGPGPLLTWPLSNPCALGWSLSTPTLSSDPCGRPGQGWVITGEQTGERFWGPPQGTQPPTLLHPVPLLSTPSPAAGILGLCTPPLFTCPHP